MNHFFLLSAAGAQPTYDYGYGRTPQTTYDTSKTYYQQAGTTTGAYPGYDASATAAKAAVSYAQPQARAPIQPAKVQQVQQYATTQAAQYAPQTTGYSPSVTTVNTTKRKKIEFHLTFTIFNP